MSRRTSTNFRTRAPFGVSMKRFTNMGLHPELDKSGSMKKTKYNLAPGQYDAHPHECAYKTQGVSRWKREQDVQEFSENLGFRNAQVLKDRTFQRTLGGPGTYDVPLNVFKQQTASALQDVGFGMQKRFWNPVRKNYPPPGTYKIKKIEKKPFSKLPTFDRDGFIDRFRDAAPPYTKPPNLYTPIYPGTVNALLTKVVSKRGPYDLFTGPRDDNNIKNHFAVPTFKGPLNWFNTWPTQLDSLLNNPNYRRTGRFFKDGRFGRVTQRHLLDDPGLCYRDPNDPSPCDYITETIRVFKPNLYAFNNSLKEARPPTKWEIHAGVGRYFPQPPRCMKLNKESWVFKSVTKRTEYKAVEYNSF